jgi:hypothetical protein
METVRLRKIHQPSQVERGAPVLQVDLYDEAGGTERCRSLGDRPGRQVDPLRRLSAWHQNYRVARRPVRVSTRAAQIEGRSRGGGQSCRYGTPWTTSGRG